MALCFERMCFILTSHLHGFIVITQPLTFWGTAEEPSNDRIFFLGVAVITVCVVYPHCAEFGVLSWVRIWNGGFDVLEKVAVDRGIFRNMLEGDLCKFMLSGSNTRRCWVDMSKRQQKIIVLKWQCAGPDGE